jgi:histidinol-phosphate aminotransferase
MRVGYALGAPAAIRPIDRIRNQFGIGRLAQAAALAALVDQDWVAHVVAQVAEGRRDYARLAGELGWQALPSATNFVAFDTGSAARARAVLETLQQQGIFIRKPATEPLDRCIRVTVGRKADRAALADAVRSATASAAG